MAYISLSQWSSLIVRLCSFFRCHLWTSVKPTSSCKSGSDRGCKGLGNKIIVVAIILYSSTFPLDHIYEEQLLWQTLTSESTDLDHRLIWRKTVLNNSGKDAEEDYFSSQTQKCIFLLFLWINNSWNACILRSWCFFVFLELSIFK